MVEPAETTSKAQQVLGGRSPVQHPRETRQISANFGSALPILDPTAKLPLRNSGRHSC